MNLYYTESRDCETTSAPSLHGGRGPCMGTRARLQVRSPDLVLGLRCRSTEFISLALIRNHSGRHQTSSAPEGDQDGRLH